jgi:hypothetical protein
MSGGGGSGECGEAHRRALGLFPCAQLNVGVCCSVASWSIAANWSIGANVSNGANVSIGEDRP